MIIMVMMGYDDDKDDYDDSGDVAMSIYQSSFVQASFFISISWVCS